LQSLPICAMKLYSLPEAALDYIISLRPDQRHLYLKEVALKNFSAAKNDPDMLERTIQALEVSIMFEKLYRNNEFLRKNFTIVYSSGGLVRNVIHDIYYSEDDLITH